MSLASKLWDCYVLTMRQRNQELTKNRLSAQGRRSAWRRWRRERAIAERMGKVRRIARRVQRLFTHHVDIEDLVQAGYLGLVSAANRYDPRVGAFPAYAYWRIRGEMIDSQKRRAFREAQNVSLHAIAAAHDGWFPPRIDTSREPLPDAVLTRDEVSGPLDCAVRLLELRSGDHARAFAMHVNGAPSRVIASRIGVTGASARAAVTGAGGGSAATVGVGKLRIDKGRPACQQRQRRRVGRQ